MRYKYYWIISAHSRRMVSVRDEIQLPDHLLAGEKIGERLTTEELREVYEERNL